MIDAGTVTGMKILLTVHQFFPKHAAGTEVLTLSVARELSVRGYDVRIFTGHPSGPGLTETERFDEYDHEGIHVYRFHHSYTPMYGQTSMMELSYDNNLAAHYFDKVLTTLKPDVVHFFHLHHLGIGLVDSTVKAGIPAFMTPTDFWAICPTGQLVLCNGSLCAGATAYAGNCVKHVAESRLKGLKGYLASKLPVTVVEFLARFTQKHNISYPYRSEVDATTGRLQKTMSRLNQLNKIVSPNRFMSEKLVQQGLSPHLITQSAFGIDLIPEIENIPRGLSGKPLRVGFIGTFVKDKGCHILIQAFQALPAGSAILKIYGNLEKYPEYTDELKRLSANSDAITFCGTFHNSKIGEVFAELDVLVVPSLWYENTPLVVYSAQAAHCPVIASDFPGLSEVIQDEVNGLLFAAGDIETLTGQLNRLMHEPGLIRQLSARSKQPKSTRQYVDELLSIWQTY